VVLLARWWEPPPLRAGAGAAARGASPRAALLFPRPTLGFYSPVAPRLYPLDDPRPLPFSVFVFFHLVLVRGDLRRLWRYGNDAPSATMVGNWTDQRMCLAFLLQGQPEAAPAPAPSCLAELYEAPTAPPSAAGPLTDAPSTLSGSRALGDWRSVGAEAAAAAVGSCTTSAGGCTTDGDTPWAAAACPVPAEQSGAFMALPPLRLVAPETVARSTEEPPLHPSLPPPPSPLSLQSATPLPWLSPHAALASWAERRPCVRAGGDAAPGAASVGRGSIQEWSGGTDPWAASTGGGQPSTGGTSWSGGRQAHGAAAGEPLASFPRPSRLPADPAPLSPVVWVTAPRPPAATASSDAHRATAAASPRTWWHVDGRATASSAAGAQTVGTASSGAASLRRTHPGAVVGARHADDGGAFGPARNVAAAAGGGGGRGGRPRVGAAVKRRFLCTRGCGGTFAHQSGTFAGSAARGVVAAGSVAAIEWGRTL